MKLTVEIEVDVTVNTEWEYDDDGCGSPSRSGNSMTGSRGKYRVPVSVSLNCTPAQLVQMVEEAAFQQNEDELSGSVADDLDGPEDDDDYYEEWDR